MLQQFNFQDHTVREVLVDDNQDFIVLAKTGEWLDIYNIDLNLIFKD